MFFFWGGILQQIVGLGGALRGLGQPGDGSKASAACGTSIGRLPGSKWHPPVDFRNQCCG